LFKVRKLRNLAEANRANLLYQRADEAWRKGQSRLAYRLFLRAAKAGMTPAFRIVGQFYDDGEGVSTNKNAALYWYSRASENGNESAANNIGCIWRDRGRLDRALRWFRRAVQLGDADANLEIAKIYVRKGNLPRARPYLEKARRSPWATEQSKEEARLLQGELKTKRAEPPGIKARPRRASRRVGAA
jgi:TPR repeat protein